MSRFKDAVKNDIDRVFLNQDEFAEVHNLDGERVKCAVSLDVTSEAGSNSRSYAYEGVFLNTLTVYVKAASISRRPVEGELWEIDGELHSVHRVSEEEGMLVVTTEASAQ